MKEFRFSRLVIALVVLMKYMTKISDAGKNPAYTSRNFPGICDQSERFAHGCCMEKVSRSRNGEGLP